MTDNAADEKFIQETIQNYFDGMYHSDTSRLEKAFHPDAHLIGHYKGNLANIPLQAWLGMIKKTPAPAENGEEYDMKIVSMDITGSAASVKVEDLYTGLKFTDYLSLMKIDTQWVIVHKTFYHEPLPE
ncbi:MAG: nuclear transport factor 2 family protein [Deltaproteobacteria bacterium]|nr:nuclear transport factor 2 family protein [Deltaproteobacteria bacterium]